MVCDNLHIICGNCGELLTIDNENNQKVRAEIWQDQDGFGVFITCENCDTVHSLSKYMEIIK